MLLPRDWVHKRAAYEDFVVMQFNCLADGLAQSGDYKFCTPEDLAWGPRWALMQEEITKVNPDVLCIQEMNHPEVLAQFMPDHYMLLCPKLASPALAMCGAPPDGCVMLLRRSMYELIDVQIMYYNVGSDLNSGAIVAAVKDRRNKRGLVFATTHLKAKSGAANEGVRMLQMSQLLGRIKGSRMMLSGLLNDEGEGDAQQVQVVLTGDFNTAPQGDVYAAVYGDAVLNFSSAYNSSQQGLQTVFAATGAGAGAGAGADAGAEGDGHAIRLPAAEYAASEPSFTTYKTRNGEGCKQHCIDYIWLGGQDASTSSKKLVLTALWSLPSAEQIGEKGLPCAAYPSDHLSLAAKFGWNGLI